MKKKRKALPKRRKVPKTLPREHKLYVHMVDKMITPIKKLGISATDKRGIERKARAFRAGLIREGMASKKRKKK